MEVLERVDPERIRSACAAEQFFWLDLVRPSDAELVELGAALSVHPLAVADSRNFEQRPKVDDLDDQLFLVFFSATGSPGGWRPLEVHVFLSGSWLVTVRRDACERLDELRGTLSRTSTGQPETHVVYRVFRALCDAVGPAIEDFDARIDAQEAAVFTDNSRAELQHLYQLRQEIGELRRRLQGTRDAWPIAQKAIPERPGLTHDSRIELSDVHDQLVEVTGELARLHDDASTLITLYFSSEGDRINRNVARLTVVATYFLVWTLVTGFFGQNFGWLVDHIKPGWSFAVFGAGGLLVPTVVLSWFFWRHRDYWK